MKSFVLVNSGFEELALQEIEELIGIKGKIGSGIVEFDAKEKDLVFLCAHGQSFKSVLVELDKNSNLDKIKFSGVSWKDSSFKIEVEGVKGNENRIEISKIVGKEIFDQTKELNLKLDYKKPEIIVKVYFDGKKYFIGIDLCGFDLTKRHYRVFVNSASLKGDLAYYLLRKSGFVKNDKLLVCFVKDGVLAIESALFNSSGIVNKDSFTLNKLPLFKDVKIKTKTEKEDKETKVYGFDESSMNIRAAKKNSKIAGTDEFLELNKFDLDEIDVKFSENEIDRLIFHITRKDEDKLNEIYYQANYVLKKKGTLLLFGRKNWEVSISDKFKLISEENIERGDSCLKVWLLEKK